MLNLQTVTYTKSTSSEHVVYKYCFECQNKHKNQFFTQHFLNMYFPGNTMNSLLSYCGLTDARVRASEKDLPVTKSNLPDKMARSINNWGHFML